MSDDPIAEYRSIVDSIYGVFLDANRGFHLVREEIQRNQKQAAASNADMTIIKLDQAHMIYGVGAPNGKDSYVLHDCTQADYKERNRKNGHNCHVIGRLCLVQIYGYWEDHYRSSIADHLGLAKNELLSDILGDLRILRNSIVHHRWIAHPDVSKCVLLNWFKEGDTISIDEKQFEQLVFEIYKYLDTLTNKAMQATPDGKR